MQYISNSYNDTFEYGKKLAKTLSQGDVLILTGDLGAGKTALTSGIVAGMELNDYVSSPTFTIVNEYRNGKTPVFHFDLLGSPFLTVLVLDLRSLAILRGKKKEKISAGISNRKEKFLYLKL